MRSTLTKVSGLALLATLLLCGARLQAAPGWVFARAVFESGASLALETVDREETRRRGMMFRRRADEGWGMLFVFEVPHRLSFWMRNTHAPLSIAFLTPEGVITNIRDMRPLDETSRHPSRGEALYAIEVRQGWFRENGVKPGQRVQLLRKQLLLGESPPRMPGADDLVGAGFPRQSRLAGELPREPERPREPIPAPDDADRGGEPRGDASPEGGPQ